MAKKSFVPGTHPVRRNVTLSHGASNVQFDALALPGRLPKTAPAGKGIKNIGVWVIEPEVKMNGAVATTFSPPLTVTVEFTPEDAKPAKKVNGKPVLYLFTAWKQGNAWKWEKLQTEVECANKSCTRGTLTAEITDLHPGDPIGGGYDD